MLASPPPLRHVIETAARGAKPAFAFAAENLDLGQALDQPERRFAALLAVPFRTPGGLQGLAVFYYGADTARPGAGGARAPGRDPARARGRPRARRHAQHRQGRRARPRARPRRQRLAAAGSSTWWRSLEELRDRLGEIRNRPDAPPWFAEQYIRLAPALGSALDDGRSLLAFGRGEIQRDTVYLEDLLAELRTPEVTVELDPGARRSAADATLLRVALRAIGRRGALARRRATPLRSRSAPEPGRTGCG